MNDGMLNLVCAAIEWDALKSAPGCEARRNRGTYNVVYLSKSIHTIAGYTGFWIRKIPLFQEDSVEVALSQSERAVRKWNELNPDFPAFQFDTGWIAPYLGNTPASDAQIAEKLIEIYRRTRNIIVDACGPMNFLVCGNDVVCVDVDQAFRRGSIVSDQYLDHGGLLEHESYWKNFAVNFKKPKTVNVLRTLVYLEDNNLDSPRLNDYLIPEVIAKLHIFRRMEADLTLDILDMLLTITRLDPNHVISDGYITPALVERLIALSKQQVITKEMVFSELEKSQVILPESFCNVVNPHQLVSQILQFNWELLDQKDHDGITFLHWAAAHGEIELAEWLCDMEVDLNRVTSPAGLTAMDLALRHGHDEIVLLLYEQGVRSSPVIDPNSHAIFFIMVQHGILGYVEEMVKRDPQIIHIRDGHNRTPLSWAKGHGRDNVVDFLLTKSAVSVRNQSVHVASSLFNSPKPNRLSNHTIKEPIHITFPG